ncbi:DUF4124 domain-containing protein [Neptunomonas sp.]|uniref:DUF4124 domain-containing protein n=1 Tax=Neptunomonas TaxID=75687 RepID=UPI003513B7B5
MPNHTQPASTSYIFCLTKPLLCLAAILSVLPAFAEVYKWKDANGKLHFSSVPPKVSESNKTTPNVEKMELKVAPPDRQNAYRQQRLLDQASYEREREERKKDRLLSRADSARKRDASEEEYREEQCEHYKEQYADIRDKDTLKAIHPLTGNTMKFSGQSAEEIRDSIKQKRDEYCD